MIWTVWHPMVIPTKWFPLVHFCTLIHVNSFWVYKKKSIGKKFLSISLVFTLKPIFLHHSSIKSTPSSVRDRQKQKNSSSEMFISTVRATNLKFEPAGTNDDYVPFASSRSVTELTCELGRSVSLYNDNLAWGF